MSILAWKEFHKNEKYQIRVHREFDELDNFFCKYRYDSELSFGFQHEADDQVSRTHTHLYFFGLKKRRNTVDDYVRSRFKGNKEFSISQTCGKDKRELDVVGAWIYGTTHELLEPRFTHGLSEGNIAALKQHAQEFWEKLEQKAAAGIKSFEIMEIIIEKEKRDNIFMHYLEKVWTNPDCKGWTISQFKKWIIADYLSQCKPVPRIMDLNRYSYSLFMLRNKPERITPEEIRLDEYEMR